MFSGLFTFPIKATEKSRADRLNWKLLINRQEKDNPNQLWTPKKQSRVCYLHFLDQKPTNSSPYPTFNLSYDSESKVCRIVPSGRKLKYRELDAPTTSELSEPLILKDDGESRPKSLSKETSVTGVAELCCFFSRNYCLDYFRFFLVSLLNYVGFAKYFQNLDDEVVFLINVLKQKNLEIEALKRKNVLLRSKVNSLMDLDFKSKCTCKLSLYSQLLKTSKDCITLV